MADQSNPPIACDMSTATDTPEERLAEYRNLFGEHLVGRERTDTGIRFRFRADPGLAENVRDLAAREKACCAFFDFAISETDQEVTWEATVIDDPAARQILDEFYQLPETAYLDVETMYERFEQRGLQIITAGDKRWEAI